MYFLVTLIIFAFVFSPSRALHCQQEINYCTFEPPKGGPADQVSGKVEFNQLTDCSVRVAGQFLSTLKYPLNPSYYNFFVIESLAARNTPIYNFDFCLGKQIDIPFACNIPAGNISYSYLAGNLCALMRRDFNNSIVNGTAPIKQ
ncbi:6029_t:CDS:1, partial [Ambispora leptoticha]